MIAESPPEALVGRVTASKAPDIKTNACILLAGTGNSPGTRVGPNSLFYTFMAS